jgi:hypothetical protein
MPDYSLVEDWLDLWEGLREAGETMPVEDFVAEHCADAPPELVEEFRSRVKSERKEVGKPWRTAGVSHLV